MMKTKRYLWLIFSLLFCFGLILGASGAGAADRSGSALSKWGASSSGDLQVKVQSAHMGNLPVNVVVYDQDWEVIADATLSGRSHTFSGLVVGDYRVLAESDESESILAEDIPIFSRQTTQVDLKLERLESSAAANAKGSLSNVTGDGNLLKIYAPYDTTVVYLQCGHIVGKVFPSGCGHRAGNWRYTTDCKKSSTIYVKLPCFR